MEGSKLPQVRLLPALAHPWQHQVIFGPNLLLQDQREGNHLKKPISQDQHFFPRLQVMSEKGKITYKAKRGSQLVLLTSPGWCSRAPGPGGRTHGVGECNRAGSYGAFLGRTPPHVLCCSSSLKYLDESI